MRLYLECAYTHGKGVMFFWGPTNSPYTFFIAMEGEKPPESPNGSIDDPLVVEMQNALQNRPEKDEEEKWKDFLVERNLKKILHQVTTDNLDASWESMLEVISAKPLSTASLKTSCLEVDLLLTLLFKETIEKFENLSVFSFLVVSLTQRYPDEVRFALPLVCETMCQTYIALPSSTELVNRLGKNFIRLIVHLLTMHREKDSSSVDVLVDTVVCVLEALVQRWTHPADVKMLSDLQEVRMSVDATAMMYLVGEISRTETLSDEMSGHVGKINGLIEMTSCNESIPTSIQDLYKRVDSDVEKEEKPTTGATCDEPKIPGERNNNEEVEEKETCVDENAEMKEQEIGSQQQQQQEKQQELEEQQLLQQQLQQQQKELQLQLQRQQQLQKERHQQELERQHEEQERLERQKQEELEHRQQQLLQLQQQEQLLLMQQQQQEHQLEQQLEQQQQLLLMQREQLHHAQRQQAQRLQQQKQPKPNLLQPQRREQLQQLQQQQIQQQRIRQQQRQQQQQQEPHHGQQYQRQNQKQQRPRQRHNKHQNHSQQQQTTLNPNAKSFTPRKSSTSSNETTDADREYQLTRGLGVLLNQLQV